METALNWRVVDIWTDDSNNQRKTYAYIAGQSGSKLHIVDISDMNNITSVERGQQTLGHILSVKEGYLLLNTAFSPFEFHYEDYANPIHEGYGCCIFDVKANPWDPPLVPVPSLYL